MKKMKIEEKKIIHSVKTSRNLDEVCIEILKVSN